MATRRSSGRVAVGVADHAGWAILMTVARDGTVLDRRRVELVDPELPRLPHHHDAQGLALDAAVALIERVRASAQRHAAACLGALEAAVPARIAAISLRRCPPLPPTIAERLASYRAQNVADTVMYRDALADAARARRWRVVWYEARSVLGDAAAAMSRAGVDDVIREAGAALGPPWQKDHRLAMAAAIAAAPVVRRMH